MPTELPPVDPHDTQPSQPIRLVADDTQPIRPVRSRWHVRLLWWVLRVGFLALLLLFALFLLIPLEDDQKAVVLEVGGVSYPVTTSADTVAELIAEQSLTVESGDILLPGPGTELEDGMVVQLSRARTVTLTVDGRISILRTVYDNPQDIIRSAGVEVTDADQIVVDGHDAGILDLIVWPQPARDIVIHSAVTITIMDDEEAITLHTTSDTVGEALHEAGISFFLADEVTPDLATPITAGMQIIITRSRELTIVADGVRIESRTTGQTVGEALAEAGIALSGLDYAMPDEASPIVPGMNVRVIRVTEDLITEEAIIPYSTIYQADAGMNLDTRRVVQAGQNGVIRRTVRARYENGVEISRRTENEEQVSQPQDEVIAYGTNIVIRTIETPDGTMEYWRKLRLYTTSYHPAALGGDNITATGEILVKGIVGVNPRIIPYYTRIYVPGYGIGIAADTGAPRSNPYWLDLGYEDHNWEHWAGWEDVYILTPVPDEIDYLLPITQQGGVVP